MFNLFRKKSQKEKLQELYSKKLKEAYSLSHSNRTESDRIMAEAEEIAKKIDSIP
ncbi:MAG: Lacal_2735 family protein [Cyclobacteriaceae bacterium]|nr:Lacal_2735 family protein [Cyclobacteriaceae bacterium]MDX5465301.1 Lacal_2735 family protein [Cyclobacteriaceae bacterium]